MAYVNQDKKAKIAAALKAALAGTNVKYSLRVSNHSTIVCTIRQADIDFIGNYNTVARKSCEYRGRDFHEVKRDDYIQVNHYHLETSFDGKALEILKRSDLSDGEDANLMVTFQERDRIVGLDRIAQDARHVAVHADAGRQHQKAEYCQKPHRRIHVEQIKAFENLEPERPEL